MGLDFALVQYRFVFGAHLYIFCCNFTQVTNFFPLIKEKKVYKTNNQRQIAELDLYKIKRNLAKSSSSYLFGTSKFYGMRYLFDL